MRSRLIAVVGSGGKSPPAVLEQAEALGAALVKAGFGIVTGGRDGVQEAVCRGAVRKRGKAASPPLVGILSGYDVTAGHAYLDVALPTGLGQARHALIASCGEVLICVGGATGALAEVALARKIGRPVIALSATGGTAGLVAKTFDSVQAVATVDEAIKRIGELLPT
ncbi:MAG: SLOG cluster 4 domain-containing protein [Planctomycetota bacterium]|jgi:uncharacterized protein (TIGR00725 family)